MSLLDGRGNTRVCRDLGALDAEKKRQRTVQTTSSGIKNISGHPPTIADTREANVNADNVGGGCSGGKGVWEEIRY